MSITSSGVDSISTGTAPTEAIAPGTGESVNALVATGSPGATPRAASAMRIAAPPEAQARQ